jgi:hypothetical protein
MSELLWWEELAIYIVISGVFCFGFFIGTVAEKINEYGKRIDKE